MTIPGIADAGLLVSMLLLAAAIEGTVRILLEDVLGWHAPPDPPMASVGARRQLRLVS